MADPRFFTKAKEHSLAALVDITQVEVNGNADIIIRDVASLDMAGPENVSFLDNVRYKDNFRKTKAAACFVTADMVEFAPDGVVSLVTPNPYKAYALASQSLYPEYRPEADISALTIPVVTNLILSALDSEIYVLIPPSR